MAKVVKQWASDDGKVWNTKKEAQDQDLILAIAEVIDGSNEINDTPEVVAANIFRTFDVRRKKTSAEG